MLAILAARSPQQAEFWSASTTWLVLGSAFLVWSLVNCARASFPRLKAPNVSLLFFGTISAYSREEYSEKFEALDAAEYLRDVLAQVHRNAEIDDHQVPIRRTGHSDATNGHTALDSRRISDLASSTCRSRPT